jgi:hypothetical protein
MMRKLCFASLALACLTSLAHAAAEAPAFDLSRTSSLADREGGSQPLIQFADAKAEDVAASKSRLEALIVDAKSLSPGGASAGRLQEIAAEMKRVISEFPHSTLLIMSEVQRLESVIASQEEMLQQAAKQASEDAARSEFQGRIDSAVEEFSGDINALGLPDEYLDAWLVLESRFGNQRWMSLREYIGLLFASGQYEFLEGATLNEVGAYGITLKRPSARGVSWFFTKEGSDLFLTYTGDSDSIWALSEQGRYQAGAIMQQAIDP